MDQRERRVEFTEALRAAVQGLLAETWTALPCVVLSYDPTKLTVKAQPTIKIKLRQPDGTQVYETVQQLVDVPVVFPRGGGFSITWPLHAGDEVLVVFAARCIDNWWKNGGVQLPAEMRVHDISDGFALPGPSSVPAVPANVSSTNLQIRTNNGLTYIEITPTGQVNIVAPLGIHVKGVITANGFVTVPPTP